MLRAGGHHQRWQARVCRPQARPLSALATSATTRYNSPTRLPISILDHSSAFHTFVGDFSNSDDVREPERKTHEGDGEEERTGEREDDGGQICEEADIEPYEEIPGGDCDGGESSPLCSIRSQSERTSQERNLYFESDREQQQNVSGMVHISSMGSYVNFDSG